MFWLIAIAYLYLGLRVFKYTEERGKQIDKTFKGYTKIGMFWIVILWPLILISLLTD